MLQFLFPSIPMMCRGPAGEQGGSGMRKTRWVLLYIAFSLCAAWLFLMGHRQVMLARAEKNVDLATWLPKKEVARLMRYHGADGLKVTRDEVYIFRDARWIPVMKRDPG
jgi:hypothetical protein